MAIFNEKQLEELLLDKKQMRPHLKACLLDGQMRQKSHIPCKKRAIRNKNRRMKELESFCTCRQPEFGNMISCDDRVRRVVSPVMHKW
jgi:hypothetical protein